MRRALPRNLPLMILGLAAVVSACEEAPQAVAERYVMAREHGHARDAYALLSQADRDVRSFRDFRDGDVQSVDDRLVRILARRTRVRTLPPAVSVKQATVGLEITRVDVDDKTRALIERELADAPEVASRLQRMKLPTRTFTETLTLRREGVGWRVFVDLAGRDESKRRTEVDRLMSLGRLRMRRGHLEWAKENFEAAFRLAPKNKEVGHALAVVRKLTDARAVEARHAEARRAYRPKVIVDQLRVRGRTVQGEVRNTGDRVLTEVEVTVVGLDGEGVPIVEARAYPVRTGDEDTPLPSKHARRFSVRFENPPSGWKGAIEARVTRILFPGSPSPD